MNIENDNKYNCLVVVRHPVGGIRTFLRYVYTRFDRQLFKFTFVLPETSELETLKENLKNLDCKFEILDKQAGIYKFTRALLKILKRENISIVHTHGFTSMIFSVIPALIFAKTHLLTSHDVFTEKQFSGFRGFLKKFILSRCFRLTDVIHLVSHDAQKNLLSYFPQLDKKKSKLTVITNGIETKMFLVEDRVDWRTELGLENDSFLIGFFGRFMAQKGFKFLIDAIEIIMRSNCNLRPVVLAFGWGGFIREEQSELKQRKLLSHFHFLPFQANPAGAIRGTDVVVMPSLWEACPLLPMEVLLAGTPIIASNCIGMREVLQGTPAKLVPAADGQALAHAICEEMKSPSKEIIWQFRNEAADRFDITNKAYQIERLIKTLAS